MRSPTSNPKVGSIVRVGELVHLDGMKPRGLYGLVANLYTNDYRDMGDLQVLTVPRSALLHPKYKTWSWELVFPFTLKDRKGNFMRLYEVEDEVECAVRALAELSDTWPVIVDDGWLC